METNTTNIDSEVIFEEMQLRKEIDRYGDISYYNKDNQLHRIYGPAIISGNYQLWLFNGKMHRIGGPARIYPSGATAWYIYGIEYSEDNYWKEVERITNGTDDININSEVIFEEMRLRKEIDQWGNIRYCQPPRSKET